MTLDKRLEDALKGSCESESLDYKRSFEPTSTAEWLELIKDIVAIANSGGGAILVGIDDDGTAANTDVSAVLAIDPADVTNKIYKYTDIQFHSFEFRKCSKGSGIVCAILVGAVRVPIVFTKVGTYPVDGTKQKTAFSVGTVYFRHGAKSEPGNSDDLRLFIERQVESIKKSWLDGIAKVVEAPAGAQIAVLPAAVHHGADAGSVPIRLVDNPDAAEYRALPIDETHPYRAKEVVNLVNERLHGKKKIAAHNITQVRRVYSCEKDRRLCYLQKHASTQYSDAFVDWMVERFRENENFFDETKRKYDEMRGKAT
jgi:hypothetical protein